MTACEQEMCPRWSGDGNVCPCAVFGIEPPRIGGDDLGHQWAVFGIEPPRIGGDDLGHPRAIDYALCLRCLVRSDRPEADALCDAAAGDGR